MEATETVFVRGIRELSEMEENVQCVYGENRGRQKRRGFGQLIVNTQSHVCAKTRWTRRHVGGVIKRLLPCCTLVHIDTLLLIQCPLFMINLIFSRNVMRTRRRDAW